MENYRQTPPQAPCTTATDNAKSQKTVKWGGFSTDVMSIVKKSLMFLDYDEQQRKKAFSLLDRTPLQKGSHAHPDHQGLAVY